MKYVKGFDTVRAFAVFFVIIYHWAPAFKENTLPYAVMKLIPSGQFGVTLFFVLSGFLITSILLKERNKQLEHPVDKRLTIVKNFFVRRVLRIFPIYYLTIFLLLALGYPYLRDHAWYFLLYASNILAYQTGYPNPMIHTWSLAVEEQFYLIWPWLILFLKEKYLKYMFVIAIVTGIVSKYIVIYMLHHGFAFLVCNCFDAFGIGGLYAYVCLNKTLQEKFDKSFIIIFPLLLFIGWRCNAMLGAPVGVIFSRTMDSIISLAIIMFVIKNRSAWLRKYFLENKFLNLIGKISYGIYLYHYILGNYYDDYVIHLTASSHKLPALITNFYGSFCIKLVLLFIISLLSYKLIEQPILRLKGRFKYTS